MIDRRSVVVATLILLASFIVPGRRANAGLFGAIKKVATAVVQGANFITNPAAQVAAATKALTPLVQQLSPDAGRASEMIQKIAEQSSTLEGRLKIATGVLVPQAIPIFANVGYQDDAVTTYAEHAGLPLTISSSVDDELRNDPTGYIERHNDLLDDYVKATSIGIIPNTYTVLSGAVHTASILSKSLQLRSATILPF